MAAGAEADLPQEGGKGYHLDVEAAPGDPKIPISMDEAHVIATPLPGRLRLSGTLELAGLDTSISRPRVDAIRAAAERVLSLDEREEIETWAGLRPCTPDGLPLLGRSARYGNLIVAAGHAMVGMSLGPVTGKIVAQLATGASPVTDIRLLDPRRFG